MLPNQPTHIFAVGTRFTAETQSRGCILYWQYLTLEYLLAVNVRERHFGGRDQEIFRTLNLKQILFEFREIAGSRKRSAVHQRGRNDFFVAVFPRMQIQHEINQRTLKPRSRALIDHETCPGQFCGALEVQNV